MHDFSVLMNVNLWMTNQTTAISAKTVPLAHQGRASHLLCENTWKTMIEGRDGKTKEGEWRFLKEALSLSPRLVPWWRDTLQWEKSSRQNKTALLSVLQLSPPARSDIHPYPSSLGHRSSGWTQQALKASSHPEEKKGQRGLWDN